MFQKSMLKEYAVVEKGNRDTVRQRDHGLQRALNGDREALGHIFASQTPRLYRAALRILGKPQDAEEALQDGFLSAIRHLGEFECRSGFSTWLTRIVINVALMRLRKSRREVLTSFDDSTTETKSTWQLRSLILDRIQRKYIKGRSGFKCWNETCGSCLRATSQSCG